jgi:hypothetical protein
MTAPLLRFTLDAMTASMMHRIMMERQDDR